MQKDVILRLCKEHDVKFIRLWFTDILGFLKGFAITINELEAAIEEGMGFDGSSIQGYAPRLGRSRASFYHSVPDMQMAEKLSSIRGRHRDTTS